MKCIIGLGNIGEEYVNTRHNMGFMCIDFLCKKFNIDIDKKKNKYMYGEGNFNGEKIVLIKPTTYMNLSGEAIVELINWYKIDLNDIIVIYDDIDLPLGEVRYREMGSSGTHNGMRNIIDNIKSEKFSRIRIGIENRSGLPIPLTNYVTSKFSKEEIDILNETNTFTKVEESVDNFLTK